MPMVRFQGRDRQVGDENRALMPMMSQVERAFH